MGLLATLALTMTLAASPSHPIDEGAKRGLAVGEFAAAFEPKHHSGPDNGTDTCPVCKYGLLPGVLVWVNGLEAEKVVPMAQFLERKVATKGPNRLRAFFVFYNPEGKPMAEYERQVADLAKRAGVKQVAFTTLPFEHHSVEDYKFGSPEEKLTVLVYRKVRVNHRFSNPGTDRTTLEAVSKAIDQELVAQSQPR